MDIPKDVDRIDFYKARIQDEIDAYKLTLPDEMLLYKVGPFRGMLKHIAVTVFKADTITDRRTDRNFNFNDPDELNQLWNIFVALSYSYNQNISIQNFAMFTGIQYTIFQQWLNPNNINSDVIYNNSSDVVFNTSKRNTDIYISMLKEWRHECEMNLQDHTMHDNSVGSMFLLKAVYGYAEQPQKIEISSSADHVDRAALMDKYKDQARPELPEMADNSEIIDK